MAEHRSKYIIKFSGIPAGDHQFTYEIGDAFFEGRDGSIILKSKVEIEAILHKSSTLQLTLKMEGVVEAECVRCLDPFELPVSVEKTLLIRMVENPSSEDDDDDAIYVANSAHELDLERHIYDFLTLQVPLHPVHPEDENGIPTCNPEVLKLLGLKTPEKDESKEQQEDRWAVLRKLKMN